jgi:hypothetical protein
VSPTREVAVPELTSFVPLSISNAEPGWRALIETDFDPAGFVIRPVIGWGVFQVRLVSDTGEVLRELGNAMEGVITWRNGLGAQLLCAQDLGNAIYLSPGTEEPADRDEVLRELAKAPRATSGQPVA